MRGSEETTVVLIEEDQARVVNGGYSLYSRGQLSVGKHSCTATSNANVRILAKVVAQKR